MKKSFVAFVLVLALGLQGGLTTVQARSTSGDSEGAVAGSYEESDSYTMTIEQITSNKQTVDTFNGVPAKYIMGAGNSRTGTYCCAGYVKSYYKTIYGITVTNLLTGRTPVASSGSFHVTSDPEAGDVGYQLDKRNGGHWFIIKSVNSDGSYTVIEQNWKWVSGGKTYCRVNRRVSYGSTNGLKIFRWSER
jgi:hypothetical protein